MSDWLDQAEKWLDDMKYEACELGRFPDHLRSAHWFDRRHTIRYRVAGWKLFRSGAYNQQVRRIHMLKALIDIARRTRES